MEEEEGEDMEDVVHEVPIEEGEEVQEVAIEGDGDCFYSAIVEAFNRNGRDLTDLPEAEVKISLNQSLDRDQKLHFCDTDVLCFFSVFI